jgi:hypothetical protein
VNYPKFGPTGNIISAFLRHVHVRQLSYTPYNHKCSVRELGVGQEGQVNTEFLVLIACVCHGS